MEITLENGKVVVAHTNGHIIRTDQPLDIQLPADFPEKYRETVINSADLCAVKKSIYNPPRFEIVTSTVNAVSI